MRKGASALAIVMLAVTVLLVGCGGTSTDTGDQSVDSTTTTILRTDTTDLAFGETGIRDGIEVTVSAPTDDPEAEAPLEDQRIVYCMVTMVNGSPEPLEYDGLDFILFDSEDQLFEDYAEASVPMLGEGMLAPGDEATGAVAYRIPLEAKVSRVAWQRNFLADPELTWSAK